MEEDNCGGVKEHFSVVVRFNSRPERGVELVLDQGNKRRPEGAEPVNKARERALGDEVAGEGRGSLGKALEAIVG